MLGLGRDGLIGFPNRDHGGENVLPLSPLFAFMLQSPMQFCLADDNYRLRMAYARITGNRPAGSGLLTRYRTKVELELLRHLGHGDPLMPVPRDANPVLIGLIRDGLIKSACLAE
jgi:hypothetical protein